MSQSSSISKVHNYPYVKRSHALAQEQSHSFTRKLMLLPPAIYSGDLEKPAFPTSFALYPFLLHRTTPWMMGTGGAFRLRKVGEWFGDPSLEGPQSLGTDRLLDTYGDELDLSAVLPKFSELSSRELKPIIKATCVRLLVLVNNYTIIPPFQFWTCSLPSIKDGSTCHVDSAS